MKVPIAIFVVLIAAASAMARGDDNPLNQEHQIPTDANGNALGVSSPDQLSPCDYVQLRQMLEDEITNAIDFYQCHSRGANISDSMLVCSHGPAPYFDRIWFVDLVNTEGVQASPGYVQIRCAPGSCIEMDYLGRDGHGNPALLSQSKLSVITLHTIDFDQESANRINQCYDKALGN